MSRRDVLSRFGMGLGAIALSDMLNPQPSTLPPANEERGVMESLHLPAKAKRVIFLFQAGGPSQIDLFDHKPLLKELHGTQLPEEIRKGQRLTSMSGNQSSIPLVSSPFQFAQYGEAGTWFSELLPQTASVADDTVCHQIGPYRSDQSWTCSHIRADRVTAPGRPSIVRG
ncbi:MAG: DUF1501 domain-containing protein [Planctomycetaceae bacterium]